MLSIPVPSHLFIWCFCYAWAGQIVLQLYQATSFRVYLLANKRRVLLLALAILIWPILLIGMVHQFWVIPLTNWLTNND